MAETQASMRWSISATSFTPTGRYRRMGAAVDDYAAALADERYS